MKSQNKAKEKTAPLKITITRVFDAPRALVFDAWTKPEHLKQWSAPHGFTLPVSEGDLRPGGSWRACMKKPHGAKLGLGGTYREVVKNELLVFTHGWEDDNGRITHETLVTVRFTDEGKKTKMIFEQEGFESIESRDGHNGGWSECFDRLAALLAGLPNLKTK